MPTPLLSHGVRRFYRRYWKRVLTFLLFIGYAGAVFWSNYDSLRQLQNDALLQFQLETEKQSAVIAYYFSERRNDIDELAASEQVVNFFRNSDLGMSFAYGLGVNVELIEGRLEQIAMRKRVGERPIYAGLLLIDSDGVPIAGWNSPDADTDYSGWLMPGNREARIRLLAQEQQQKSELVVSSPVWIDNVYRGELLAWTSAGASLAQFGRPNSRWYSFLVDQQTGKALSAGLGSALLQTRLEVALVRQSRQDASSVATLGGGDGRQLAFARVNISKTPLAFVSVTSEFPDERGLGRLFLLAAGVLPFIVLLVAVLDVMERRRLEDLQERARLEAERLAQARSDFLANMSHEIRTPMNAIIGMTDLCLESPAVGSDSRQRSYLNKIRGASNSLLRIVNDILDFSRIESGKLEIERIPFELDPVLDDLGTLFARKASEKGIELIFDVDDSASPIFIGDPLRLKQILINLIDNAIKFSGHGTIQVRIRAQSVDLSTQLHLQVIDQGIGLSEEQRRRLFTAFTQADATTTRRYGGTGLGLAICRQLVELMGGRIEVESTLGQGSCFQVFVPLGVEHARLSSAARMQLSLAVHAACPVLVVDGNPRSRAAIAAQLRQIGLMAELCATCDAASAALVRLQAPVYLAVLIDSTLPESCGAGVRQLRHHLGNAAPPVILVGGADIELSGASSSHAFAAVLLKPTTASRLFATLAPFLGVDVQPGFPPESEMPPTGEPFNLRGVDVLLVDDVVLNQEVVRDQLEDAGLRVRVASNGQEALAAIAEKMPDCVLMDCQMPVMDGYEATRQLRADERYRRLVVIALTASALPSERQRCLAAGMDGYLAKPVRAHDLLAALHGHLTARGIIPLQGTTAAKAVDSQEEGLQKRRRPATITALPDLPGIDGDDGLRHANGKPALYHELLRVFSDSHGRGFAPGFRHALDNDDWRAATRMAHTLKSSARTIGANALAELAGELEEACRQQQRPVVDRWLDRVLSQLTKVTNGLAVVGGD